MMRAVSIAQVPVHDVDLRGALARVDELVAEGGAHYNIAINAAKVVAAQRDVALQRAIADAHLLTADGQAIVWAARLLGHALPERVAGADLMEALFARAEERGYSVYLLGARRDVLERALARLGQTHPGLRIAGARDGYFADEQAVVDEIRAAKPDLLFLGFGTPAKEYFMHRRYRELGVPFTMGVGGAFDVYAELVRRAPRWIQRAGLEWAFRLAQEPRRMWKRYLVGNSRFIWLVVRELVA